MFKGRDSELAEILEAAAVLEIGQLEAYSKQAFEQSREFGECVISGGALSESQLLQIVAAHLELGLMQDFAGERVDAAHIPKNVPMQIALRYGVFLLGEDFDGMHLAVADPFDHEIEMDLEHLLSRSVHLYVANPGWVESQIAAVYPDHELSKGPGAVDGERAMVVAGLENSATIIDYVDRLLQKSIHDGASDIHFEPFEHCFRIRYRVDGVLREIPSHAEHLGSAIVSRIKVMAQLNIAEDRVPQDGRIRVQSMGRFVDVRVSTLPTQFGESVVLRILDKSRVHLDLDLLGMPDDVSSALKRCIHVPNGIFLATGPTGSGKTTTLYSALRKLNQPGSKLLTVEDPVEYDIDGIVQVQTHSHIGLDFARALRAFLRHDPDKILLGEIRDPETARIAVQASLTGHMVFSSLHTNDAAGAVTRFVDMGVEPYLVAASLIAVLAQRLLRRVDPDNSEAYIPDDVVLGMLACSREDIGDAMFFRPRDSSLPGGGYRGRVGLYEMIVINDNFREAITLRNSHSELVKLAAMCGMRNLRSDGIRILKLGHTTVEEVIRYT